MKGSKEQFEDMRQREIQKEIEEQNDERHLE